MAKVISYKYVAGESNHGTADKPDIEQILNAKKFICKTQAAYDANYPIAEKEAIPGTIEVTGNFEPEGDTATTDDVLNALLGVSV